MKIIKKDDLTIKAPLSDVISSISQELNRRLIEGHKGGNVIRHNLEYGLGSEAILRDLLGELLPSKYGVGKGKLINLKGQMSDHLDIIIYDRLNGPVFLKDKNANLILPVESAFHVIEVKSQTNSTVLKKAFQNLASVRKLIKPPFKCSVREMVDYYPPNLSIISFNDSRTLETILDNYVRLSREFAQDYSYGQYSKKSPGFKSCTGKTYLVSDINIIGKGTVYHMLNGSPSLCRFGENTFGMFYSQLLSNLHEITLKKLQPLSYFHWYGSGVREIYE